MDVEALKTYGEVDGEDTARLPGDDGAVPHGDCELVRRDRLIVERPSHRDLPRVPVNREQILRLRGLRVRDEKPNLPVWTCINGTKFLYCINGTKFLYCINGAKLLYCIKIRVKFLIGERCKHSATKTCLLAAMPEKVSLSFIKFKNEKSYRGQGRWRSPWQRTCRWPGSPGRWSRTPGWRWIVGRSGSLAPPVSRQPWRSSSLVTLETDMLEW